MKKSMKVGFGILPVLFLSLLWAVLREKLQHPIWKNTLPVLVDHWGFDHEDIPNLRGKVVIVTGANSGIGKSSSKLLVLNGAKVIMGCRDMEKCELAKSDIIDEISEMGKHDRFERKVQMMFEKSNLVPMLLDMSSLASINKFVSRFQGKNKKLHSLILNAGVQMVPYSLTEDGVESHFGVNHIGNFYMAKLLRSILEFSQPASLTLVSSSLHHRGDQLEHLLPLKIVKGDGSAPLLHQINNISRYSPQTAYAMSKLANIAFTNQLSRIMKVTGRKVCVNAVHPGLVFTNAYTNADIDSNLKTVWSYIGWMFQKWAMFDPDTAAMGVLYSAVSNAVFEQDITGEYLVPVGNIANTSDTARDTQFQENLWVFTDQLIRELGFA